MHFYPFSVSIYYNQQPLAVTYERNTRELDVYVVRGGGPPLLGRDFISLFNLHLTTCHFVSSVNNCVQDLERQYPEVFSSKLGMFNKYKVKLRLRDDAKPVFIKARPLAFSLRDKIGEELERLVGLGILKPVEHSRFASPVVPVLKRDGSVRLCVDYSVSINKLLVVEHYPLPTVHELFSRLHGGQEFTKLDLSSAYNQFVLDEDSQELTCINTHRGLFKYTRMSFGLTSAPSIFQRAMEGVLAGMDGVLCLLDDILITASNREEHVQRIHEVLKRLQDAGLTLQRSKCEFFKDEISYLGYVINKYGLKKSPDKVKAIVNAPRPDNVQRLQSFLGLVNYYRNFVNGASSLLAPLYELLKKGTKWTWSQEHEHAFTEIKKRLASDRVLTHYNPSAKLILTVDASPSGLGAVLSQVDETGAERPISFASRTLNSAEKRYSQIQKEATAIIFGVRRFHQYLYGRACPFILRTDHKPLISIFGPYKGIPEVSANRLQRYAMFLSAYNYIIEYVRSANNCADYLSRASLPDVQPLAPDPADATGVEDGVDRASYINFIVNGDIPVTLSRVRDETLKDSLLQTIKTYILNGWPKGNVDDRIIPYRLCRAQLSYENGCIMRGHKVVIPESLKTEVLRELHRSHLGMVKTKAEARARLWFPGIDGAIETMIRTCAICSQLRPSPPRVPPEPWSYPKVAFERVHLDFLGPIYGRTYLVVVDAYTKWVEVHQCRNTSSSEVIDKMYEYISRFGLPRTIVSDNGTGFTSYEFQNFCQSNGIAHVTSPAYHPASNGQAESFVKIVKKGIKSALLLTDNVERQKILLLKYLFDYRNSVHSATGLSPAQMVYGRNLRCRLDLIKSSSPSLSSSSLVNKKQCLQSNREGNKSEASFEPGDEIMYKKYLNNNKFVWERGTILDKIGKVVYLIFDHQTSSHVKKHKNQVVLHSRRTWPAFLDSAQNSEPQESTGGDERHQNVDDNNNVSLFPGADTVSSPLSSRNPNRLLRNIPRDYRSTEYGVLVYCDIGCIGDGSDYCELLIAFEVDRIQ
ncbi:uncharacterized protein K02A2.6-like [Aricia agestis]|uniref:uncharacterized protein K02A2.6-like n=1 Tax=Aricia agestis TaxID=91739 RepID=UPI001C208360|nr:uncharacterized protein K02A2.6-like [Aricia agestis]